MTDTYAITPKQALGIIEALGVEDAFKLIRDHAAAGLVRSYAQLQVTIDAEGSRQEIRGARVPPATWERIIAAGVDHDVWSGGTVRLPGSDLIGGTPTIHVTGVAFHPADIDRLAAQQRLAPPAKRFGATAATAAGDDAHEGTVSAPVRRKPIPDLSALHSGALLLTVEQTKAALAIGHTKFYKMLNAGELERAPFEGGTRITAASVRKLAGLTN